MKSMPQIDSMPQMKSGFRLEDAWNGAPKEIRTPDPLVRREDLCEKYYLKSVTYDVCKYHI